MEKVYKVEKINEDGNRQTKSGLKRYKVGGIHICQNEEEYNYLLSEEKHHWADACEPVPEPVKDKPKPKKNVKKGGDK